MLTRQDLNLNNNMYVDFTYQFTISKYIGENRGSGYSTPHSNR